MSIVTRASMEVPLPEAVVQTTEDKEFHEVEAHELPERNTDSVLSASVNPRPWIVTSVEPEDGEFIAARAVSTGASYVNIP